MLKFGYFLFNLSGNTVCYEINLKKFWEGTNFPTTALNRSTYTFHFKSWISTIRHFNSMDRMESLELIKIDLRIKYLKDRDDLQRQVRAEAVNFVNFDGLDR